MIILVCSICLIAFSWDGFDLMQGATLAAIILTTDVSSLPTSTFDCPKNKLNTLNEVVYNIAIVIILKAVPWFKEPEQLKFFFSFLFFVHLDISRYCWTGKCQVHSKLGLDTTHSEKSKVPPQYLHKCSGGLVGVGTNEESPEGRKARNIKEKKKVQNYSLSVEVLFGIVTCDLSGSHANVKKKKNKKKTEKKNIMYFPLLSLSFSWASVLPSCYDHYLLKANFIFGMDCNIQIAKNFMGILVMFWIFSFQNSRYYAIRLMS